MCLPVVLATRAHAPDMNPFIQALLTDGSCVSVTISGIEVALVDALPTDLTVHVLKVVNFLDLVGHLLALQATQDVTTADSVDFLFALGTAVLHVADPPTDALIAVLVRAGV